MVDLRRAELRLHKIGRILDLIGHLEGMHVDYVEDKHYLPLVQNAREPAAGRSRVAAADAHVADAP